MLSLDPKQLSVPQVHQYLLGAVGPRPICFASTVDKEGNPNLAPFSFFNVFSANPPVAIFAPNRSGRTGANKDTFENVKEVPECVINIVNYDMVHQTSLASSPFPKGTSEFLKSGFTPIASDKVKPFRVKESPAQFECKVTQIIELGQQGGAGNLVICEVVMMHISEDVLDADKKIDQQKIDLVARMGGNWYCRAHGDALFEIEKPITTIGIGVDQLPEVVKNSKVLTGNNLGQLGNIEVLPNADEISTYRATQKNAFKNTDELHAFVKTLLEAKKLKEAWLALLANAN